MALPEHRKQRNWGPRVHEIVWHGIPTVVMENELLRVSILAGKGTDIIELLYKPRDLDFAWLTPGGIRNPLAYLPSSPDAMPFSEYYPGGWQEIFPHGGVPGESNGTTFGQHAEVYALPWDTELVRDDESGVSVRFIRDVEHGKQSIQLDSLVAVLEALGLELQLAVRAPTLTPWTEGA